MAQIEIVPAKGLANFLTYNKLPRLLYKGARGFAPPLDVERWTLHAHMLNPHFKLVEAQEFLARRDGQWVGRILAQVYKPEITPVEASRFQFGSLDAVDDIEVVRALTKTAEDWLKARGAEIIHGPFSPSINGEMGVLVEGFERSCSVCWPLQICNDRAELQRDLLLHEWRCAAGKVDAHDEFFPRSHRTAFTPHQEHGIPVLRHDVFHSHCSLE